MQQLETLDITPPSDSLESTYQILPSIELSVKRFPALRVLKLEAVGLPNFSDISPIVTQLTTLELRRCTFSGPPLAFDAFVDVFDKCPSLQALSLTDIISRASSRPTGIPPRTVQLVNLNTLVVYDNPHFLSSFFTCIRLPDKANTTLISDTRHAGDNENLTFSAILPPDPSHISPV